MGDGGVIARWPGFKADATAVRRAAARLRKSLMATSLSEPKSVVWVGWSRGHSRARETSASVRW